jgi:hypothetical protein
MFDNNQPTTETAITITTRTLSESCFALEHGTGESVFVPASVSIRANLKVGDVLVANVIPNPVENSRDRTPFMAVHVAPYAITAHTSKPPTITAESAAEVSADDARQFTNNLLMAGGCWNNLDVFCSLMNDENARRDDNAVAYAAIGNELRRMFSSDVASKFTLYRTGSQTRASAEWFTTTPDQCEPMDWSEEDA